MPNGSDAQLENSFNNVAQGLGGTALASLVAADRAPLLPAKDEVPLPGRAGVNTGVMLDRSYVARAVGCEIPTLRGDVGSVPPLFGIGIVGSTQGCVNGVPIPIHKPKSFSEATHALPPTQARVWPMPCAHSSPVVVCGPEVVENEDFYIRQGAVCRFDGLWPSLPDLHERCFSVGHLASGFPSARRKDTATWWKDALSDHLTVDSPPSLVPSTEDSSLVDVAPHPNLAIPSMDTVPQSVVAALTDIAYSSLNIAVDPPFVPVSSSARPVCGGSLSVVVVDGQLILPRSVDLGSEPSWSIVQKKKKKGLPKPRPRVLGVSPNPPDSGVSTIVLLPACCLSAACVLVLSCV